MNNKLLLVFILLFLVFLLIFYYIKLKTNLILLLSVIIVLCINNLIIQKEYFSNLKTYNNNNIATTLIEYIQKIINTSSVPTTPTNDTVSTFNSSELEGNLNHIPTCSSSCSVKQMLNKIKPEPISTIITLAEPNTTYPTFKFEDLSTDPVTITTATS